MVPDNTKIPFLQLSEMKHDSTEALPDISWLVPGFTDLLRDLGAHWLFVTTSELKCLCAIRATLTEKSSGSSGYAANKMFMLRAWFWLTLLVSRLGVGLEADTMNRGFVRLLLQSSCVFRVRGMHYTVLKPSDSTAVRVIAVHTC